MNTDAYVRKELSDTLKKLRGYAILMAGLQDADDILQTTALKALENAHQFMPGTNLKNWLHRIMVNEFLETKRGGKNQLHHPLEAVSENDFGRSGNQETVVFFREVVAAVSRLKPVLRGAMTALIDNDMDAVFGAKVTARAHLAKARIALKGLTA